MAVRPDPAATTHSRFFLAQLIAMTTDHTAFIERHHKTDRKFRSSPPRGRKRATAFVIFLVLAYLGLCIMVGDAMGLSPRAIGVLVVLYAGAVLIAFGGQRLIRMLSRQEKEYRILRRVLEGSRGARLITDSADNTVYANQRFASLVEEVGPPTLDALTRLFAHNAEALAHFRMLADQAHRGLTDTIELQAPGKRGAIWYKVTAQPVAGWAGYIHWRIDDVTGEREMDLAIREEREKLIDFTDNAPVGFFSLDENGRFVFVNATLARWLGEDIETLLSRAALHTYMQNPPEDAASYDIDEKGGARQVVETIMKGPGGKTFLASINQTVVHEEGGRVRTRGVMHDLTSERAMRQALKASEDRFQKFFEEAPLGIALLNQDRKITDCNPMLARMLSTQVANLEGRIFTDIVREEGRETAAEALERLEEGYEMETPLEITLYGQEDVVVSMYARRLRAGENIVLHFIDLTHQKALEVQFTQSQKMQAVGQLAGGVAHDFNNLLTAIIGFCDLLLLRHKPGDPSFSDIMQIKQNSNRASNLVRQLLAFSRQQTLRPRIHDITDILTEVSHLIRRLIGANIELDLQHGSDPGLIKVDEGQMEQVMINLAVNARDAMEDDGGGKLTITTSLYENSQTVVRGEDEMPPGQWTLIRVEDTGCGMPRKVMDHIFEPFFTTKDVGQGTGLGLATVYGIIRQTGGYLHVESEVGQGTAFLIYLPVVSEEESEGEGTRRQVEEDKTRDLTGTARLMLVEDEDAVRTFSTRALANKGYDVLSAESGEAALQKLEENAGQDLDLLITDVMMPNMDGPTLVQRVRQDSPDLKVIFISGYTEEKLKDYMGENIWFLPKPFTLKQLASKVKDVLDE